MRETILYIAMSIDGYIADEKGGVAWLAGDQSDEANQGSYPNFINTVDSVVMGYSTYHQISTELFSVQWPYVGKKSYILTHKQCQSSDEIIFVNQSCSDFITSLKNQGGKDIWICGGASIVNQLLDVDLIDQFCISIIPTILGKGIPLFTPREKQLKLQLVSTLSYNGITDLVYRRRK